MSTMNTRAIGEATTALLDYAQRENLSPTTEPIRVSESGSGYWCVTLHACSSISGDDYLVRLGVEPSGILGAALVREWDPELDEMSDWRAIPAAEVLS